MSRVPKGSKGRSRQNAGPRQNARREEDEETSGGRKIAGPRTKERRKEMERERERKRNFDEEGRQNRSRVDGRTQHGGNQPRRRDVYTLEECIVHHGVA